MNVNESFDSSSLYSMDRSIKTGRKRIIVVNSVASYSKPFPLDLLFSRVLSVIMNYFSILLRVRNIFKVSTNFLSTNVPAEAHY